MEPLMQSDPWTKIEMNVVRPICRRVVNARKHDPDTRAAEILGTIFLRSPTRPPSELNGQWLIQTAYGEAQKTYRQRKLVAACFEPAGSACEPDTGTPSVLESLCATERLSFLRTFVSELGERDRLVLYTRFPLRGERLSEADVARELGVTESRVRQIRVQLIDVLRDKFAARYPESLS